MLKKKENFEKIDTIIGKNSYFEGKYKSSGILRIDGKFHGELEIDGDVVVGESGIIKGIIKARNVDISGSVEGNISAEGLVKISSTGKLIGDIVVENLVIEEKGIFDGKCSMKDNTASKEDNSVNIN